MNEIPDLRAMPLPTNMRTIFLISADGDVVYSLNREAELFNFID